MGRAVGEVILSIARTLAAAGGLVAVYYLLFYWLVPKVLITGSFFANRELMTLLAIIAAAGSTWCAHAVGLSPALGAFLAGMLLGESPFAVQIRSDVGALRTLFVTLFFTSIGMLMDPIWLLNYGPTAFAAAAVVICVKTAIIYFIVRALGLNRRYALASGLALSQIGEFGYANRGLYRKIEKGATFLEPLKGRRIWFPSRYTDVPGSGLFQRAYTLVVTPDGTGVPCWLFTVSV